MCSRFRILPGILLVAVSLTVSAEAQSQRVIGIISERAPVTLTPEAGRTPLATLDPGTAVQVLGPAKKGWYRISFQDGYLFGDRVGYVRVEHLRVASSGPDPFRSNGVTDFSVGGITAATRASRYALSTESIISAVVEGRQRPGPHGLSLVEYGESSTRSGSSNGAGRASSPFSLELYTPIAWIRQLSSDASRENRRFDVSDVTEEVAGPVLRVVAYSDTSDMPSGGSSWARHVALRSLSRSVVVQPLSKQPFAEHVVDATGSRAVAQGLRLTFPLDAVRDLKGPTGDIEFFIVVTGPAGQERSIRITKRQLAELPM